MLAIQTYIVAVSVSIIIWNSYVLAYACRRRIFAEYTETRPFLRGVLDALWKISAAHTAAIPVLMCLLIFRNYLGLQNVLDITPGVYVAAIIFQYGLALTMSTTPATLLFITMSNLQEAESTRKETA